jgi:hypothetical protein
MFKLLSAFALFCVTVFAHADAERAKRYDFDVIRTLDKNKVVVAAILEAKRVTGAHACKVTVIKAEKPEGFTGQVFDVDVMYSCGENGRPGSGMVFIGVKGRLFGDGPLQEIDLSIRMAG